MFKQSNAFMHRVRKLVSCSKTSSFSVSFRCMQYIHDASYYCLLIYYNINKLKRKKNLIFLSFDSGYKNYSCIDIFSFKFFFPMSDYYL